MKKIFIFVLVFMLSCALLSSLIPFQSLEDDWHDSHVGSDATPENPEDPGGSDDPAEPEDPEDPIDPVDPVEKWECLCDGTENQIGTECITCGCVQRASENGGCGYGNTCPDCEIGTLGYRGYCDNPDCISNENEPGVWICICKDVVCVTGEFCRECGRSQEQSEADREFDEVYSGPCLVCEFGFISKSTGLCNNTDCPSNADVSICPVCGTGTLTEAGGLCSWLECPSYGDFGGDGNSDWHCHCGNSAIAWDIDICDICGCTQTKSENDPCKYGTTCTVCGTGKLTEAGGLCSWLDCPSYSGGTTAEWSCHCGGTAIVEGEACYTCGCTQSESEAGGVCDNGSDAVNCPDCDGGKVYEGYGCNNEDCPSHHPFENKCGTCNGWYDSVYDDCPDCNPNVPGGSGDPDEGSGWDCHCGWTGNVDRMLCGNCSCTEEESDVLKETGGSCGMDGIDCPDCDTGRIHQGYGCNNPDCPSHNS